MPRGPNWTDNEDISLTRAYLHVSSDPIIGDQQQSDTFWIRVAKELMGINGPNGQQRSTVAIKSRWHVINHDVSKFVGFLEKVNALNPSGENVNGCVARAKNMYKEVSVDKKPFAFEGCWMVLRRLLFFFLFNF
jgi:hypothetical protein